MVFGLAEPDPHFARPAEDLPWTEDSRLKAPRSHFALFGADLLLFFGGDLKDKVLSIPVNWQAQSLTGLKFLKPEEVDARENVEDSLAPGERFALKRCSSARGIDLSEGDLLVLPVED